MEPQEEQSAREWVVWEPQSEGFAEHVDELDIHPLTARILHQRGFRELEAADAFLNPTLRHMRDPFTMKGMEEAVHQVLRALDRGERIVIHGDYDVDGVCSVSVLYEFLHVLGANVDFHIPQRDQEGYGLNAKTVRRLGAEGCDLIITTDCGISNVSEITLARELGMRVIVVDHHTVPPVLPPADAILNPLQPGCNYGFKQLAAVGVTFNLVVALRSRLRKHGVFEQIPEPDLRNSLDLVALGTVADVVPLTDENRIFVRHGLEVIAGRRRPGVAALMERASAEGGRVTPQTISYRLAPRINAAGRMGDASMCVELLTTQSYGRALDLASQLEVLNKSRQELERQVLMAALPQAERQVEENRQILLVYGEDWHRGVLGIVASRLVERYNRPAILMGIDDGQAKGSARSIDGINVIAVIAKASELLDSFGGHTAAAGLAIPAKHLIEFRERIDAGMREALSNEPLPHPILHIDCVVELSELDDHFARDLDKLGPFGTGNREPVLLCRQSLASNVRIVGRNHLKARFREGNTMLEGIGFSMSESVPLLSGPVAVAFVPRYAHYRGRNRLEMHLRGVRPALTERPERPDKR
ncbi:MAG: single-stranded-DNA-specific exonuclease RecJ [Bradymonadaceae bacterium]|nr:single-stranded-DNA-specific exonuclease RecJ [Lujinxingiaceae bacterium]